MKTATAGYLHGLVQNNAILVMGFSLNESVEKHLPFGYKDLGSIQWSNDGNFSQPTVRNPKYFSFCNITFMKLNRFQETDVVQLKYNLQSSDNHLIVLCKSKSGDWDTVEFVELSDDELKKEWICVRTQFHLKYCVNDSSAYREQLLQLLQNTRLKICETNKPILKVCETEIVLKKDKGLVGIGKNAKLTAAVQQTKANSKNTNPNQFDTLNIEIGSGDDDTSTDDISTLFSSKFRTEHLY